MMLLPPLPQVRGHHLLCLLTYVGEGYTPVFVAAMDALVTHLTAGGAIALCEGPDVLCAALQNGASAFGQHCHKARNLERDRVALQEIGKLAGLSLAAQTRIDAQTLPLGAMRRTLQELDAAASLEGLRQACGQCEWLGLCRRVSCADFATAKLKSD